MMFSLILVAYKVFDGVVSILETSVIFHNIRKKNFKVLSFVHANQ